MQCCSETNFAVCLLLLLRMQSDYLYTVIVKKAYFAYIKVTVSANTPAVKNDFSHSVAQKAKVILNSRENVLGYSTDFNDSIMSTVFSLK